MFSQLNRSARSAKLLHLSAWSSAIALTSPSSSMIKTEDEDRTWSGSENAELAEHPGPSKCVEQPDTALCENSGANVSAVPPAVSIFGWSF